jgi:hypothetical protein
MVSFATKKSIGQAQWIKKSTALKETHDYDSTADKVSRLSQKKNNLCDFHLWNRENTTKQAKNNTGKGLLLLNGGGLYYSLTTVQGLFHTNDLKLSSF